ncbi:26S proteasome regulatory subunit rpn1 [Nosema bombycis CQ1]|uniref:26S proteasome regulatory subunit rpn1 n=1 Tax=Nosema bombycis (strain CQ1 / CVCC 102059) TaxID=578461 RepID=R0MLF2_NOSB1|nr:26S proteasome regulatory subunit rpn1 [Nosema bombycis CQ1]|eukprot:EOB13658.1 26S proteasome regulatory subunit rpn1 [Nosema bombycis CQ1]
MENENLNIIIERLQEKDEGVKISAMNMLIDLIKQSQSGSIDTLNFQHLSEKKNVLLEMTGTISPSLKPKLFDVVSAISIIGNDKDILKYRIEGNTIPLSEWGHLYVKKLTGCIIDAKQGKFPDIPFESTLEVGQLCKEFLFRNNLEFEAIDFLIDIEKICDVVEYVDNHNYKRIILYLEEMAVFSDLKNVLNEIYKKMEDHAKFVCHAIEQGKKKQAIEYTKNIKDPRIRRQILYILAKLHVFYESRDPEERQILSNEHVKTIYKEVVQALELDTKPVTQKRSKYEKDLHKPIHQASFSPITLTNGFIHMGYEQDTIFFPRDSTPAPLDYEAILNSDIPELVTVLASVGVIGLWNPPKVLELLQEHIFGEISRKKTGSLLALALSSTHIYDDNQTYLSLLTGNLQSNDLIHILPTLLGIQSLYSGTFTNDDPDSNTLQNLKEILTPLLFSESHEIALFTSFVLGSIFVGSADDELVSIFMQMFIEKEEHADTHFFKLHMLGLALLYYKRPDVECCISELETNYSRHGSILVKGFQFIRSGDPEVVKNIFADSFTGETDALLESLAILSCSLIGMGDEVAFQMVSRIATSSLLLESSHLKSVLPLCYALLYTSNPQPSVIDVLEKSLNSGDSNVVIPTIFALGVIGGGTVNGRIQKILDQQFSYFYKDPKASSVLKISQGLLSLGKGMGTLSPFFYDKTVLSPKNLIGLFATTLLFLEPLNSPLLNDHPYFFYLPGAGLFY